MKKNEKFFFKKMKKKEKMEKWKKNEKMKKMKKWKKWEKMKKWKKKWKNEKIKKKWKNEKNEKKTKKMEKNDEKRKKNEKNWIHTQNPRRFPGFTVVVVTFFVKILGMCLFPEENQQPVLGVIVFPKKSDNFHWTWNKNTHFTDENERKKIAKVSPSNNNYSFRII